MNQSERGGYADGSLDAAHCKERRAGGKMDLALIEGPRRSAPGVGTDSIPFPAAEDSLMPDRMTMKSAPSTLVEGQRLDQPTFHALYQARVHDSQLHRYRRRQHLHGQRLDGERIADR